MSDCTKNTCKCSGENATNDTKPEDKDITQGQNSELDESSLDNVTGGFAPSKSLGGSVYPNNNFRPNL